MSIAVSGMGKVKNAPQAAPEAADPSWSSDLARQLHPTVRYTLIVDEKTAFATLELRSFVHKETKEHINYTQIAAYKLDRARRRIKNYYACNGPQHVCTGVSVYDDESEIINHMLHQHKPHILCAICSRQCTPAQYKAHYEACSRIATSATRQARKQQTDDMELESELLVEEMNDAKQQIDVNITENKLVEDTSDEYIPVVRDKRTSTLNVSTPLLRIESLQFYDNAIRVRNDTTGTEEHTEWSPQCCDKADKCNVVQHGTFVRFCYDTSEAFLIEIKRYRCTTHYTIKDKKKSHVTFNMLSECVNKQMNEKLTVRKSLDVHIFDTVLITAKLWQKIADNTLITLNDSHVNTMLKHSYRREWDRKLQLHKDNKSTSDPNHLCTARQCYGLTMRKADEWMQLYRTITQRAVDVSTTRALYQRHIFPKAVLPCHNQLQHKLITEHCGTAISLDNTFKMAKFGRYNEWMKDTITVASSRAAADAIMATTDAPGEPDSTPATLSAPASGTLPVKRKREYNQSVTFTKLNAQLMTVMDSNGYALCSYVVPSGKSSYQLRCLQQLLAMQHVDGQPVRIKTVSVDNASQVGPSLRAHYNLVTGEQLTVLQDLYHARERIEREFVFGHPLIRQARADWRKLIGDVIEGRCTQDEWKTNMNTFRDQYSSPVKYSAVGEMAMVSQIAQSLLADDPVKQQEVLSGEELVDRYSRHHPDDVDGSNNIVQAVLRQPGVTALNNLITDDNIAYVFDRTQAHCINTKGTTPNEALHRIFNGRLSRFGGIRTFASAQQCIIAIQYQYNTQKLYNSSQYWCAIQSLPIHNIRQAYDEPLGEPDKDVLQRLEVEWSAVSKWMPSHTVKLHELVIALSTGQLYCHTKSLCQWLSQQDGMEGTKPTVIGQKLRKLQTELTTLPRRTQPSPTSSSSVVTRSPIVQ